MLYSGGSVTSEETFFSLKLFVTQNCNSQNDVFCMFKEGSEGKKLLKRLQKFNPKVNITFSMHNNNKILF